MKVSIIVPIYQKETVLSKTIDSILEQSFQDFEIILVNDGSKDNSKQIMEEYALKYPAKIRAFNKENGGLSSARNFGIEQAKGDYIFFVDAGDYLDTNLLEHLKMYMHEQIDMIKFKMVRVDEKYQLIDKLDGPVFDICKGEEAFEKLYATDNFMEVACIYLYRRSFFVENKFQFDSNQYHEDYGGAYHEDFGLTPLVLVKAKTVISTNEFGYFYVQADGSITRNSDYHKTVDRANDLLVHYDFMLSQIQTYSITDKTKHLIKTYYTNSILLKLKELKPQDQNNYIQEMKKRNLYHNIKPTNVKQWIKKILLYVNVKLYIKLK